MEGRPNVIVVTFAVPTLAVNTWVPAADNPIKLVAAYNPPEFPEKEYAGADDDPIGAVICNVDAIEVVETVNRTVPFLETPN